MIVTYYTCAHSTTNIHTLATLNNMLRQAITHKLSSNLQQSVLFNNYVGKPNKNHTSTKIKLAPPEFGTSLDYWLQASTSLNRLMVM